MRMAKQQNLRFSRASHGRSQRILCATIFFSLLLTGCFGGGSGIAFEQYTGTDGLVVSFKEVAPPEQVYENAPFPVAVEVQNRGAHNVTYDKMILTFNTDPVYIAGGISPYDPAIHDADALASDKFLDGRTLSYPEGESRLFSIPGRNSFFTKKILGQREAPTVSLRADLCYAYRTTLSTEVCIDTNLYGQNLREQPCVAEDISFSNGQGAPIAITAVEVKAIPVLAPAEDVEVIQPIFTITLGDVGQGYLIGPDTLPFESACLLKGIQRSELNAVYFRAWLLGSELECKPGKIIRIEDGEATVTCTISEQELVNPVFRSTQNFQSVLRMEASYLYKTFDTTEITIQRLGVSNDEVISGAIGEATGYYYVNGEIATDAFGKPIDKCTQFVKNPSSAPPEIASKLTPDFKCTCGRTECLQLARDGRCIAGLCPGTSFCCDETKRKPVETSESGVEPVVSSPKEPSTTESPQEPVIELSAPAWVAKAKAEWEYFGEGQIAECNAQVKNRVEEYFSAGNCASSSTCSATPWSAAFISYVMTSSGASFPSNCAHTAYFSAIRDAPGKYSCTARRMSDIGTLKPGDILCACREGGCPITFDSAKNQASHCDIVSAVENGKIELIGGNLDDTVAKRSVSVSQLGSSYYGFLSCG